MNSSKVHYEVVKDVFYYYYISQTKEEEGAYWRTKSIESLPKISGLQIISLEEPLNDDKRVLLLFGTVLLDLDWAGDNQ
jgi:hypothetical protein